MKILKHKLFPIVFKILLFVALLFILFKQLSTNNNLDNAIVIFKTKYNSNFGLIILVFFLMICNWLTETTKWFLLINKWNKISFLKAIEGILLGITFSMFTPNRIGEFGGRVWALKKNRITAIVSTLIGSYSQIVINLCVGVIGFFAYNIYVNKIHFYYFLVGSFLLFFILLFTHISYYNLDYVSNKFSKIKALQKAKKYLFVINKYNNFDLLKIELLSFVRYSIYCIQFYVLLLFFGVEISFPIALILICSVFFIQTINPISIDLLDIGIRTNIAIFFFSKFTNNEIGVLASTVFLWIINLIIPAFFGSLVILHFKFFKTEEVQN